MGRTSTVRGVLFSTKVDEVEVNGRIDRCFARQNTVNLAPSNRDNQQERLEAGVPWRLSSYPGIRVLWPISVPDLRFFLVRIFPLPKNCVEHPGYNKLTTVPQIGCVCRASI